MAILGHDLRAPLTATQLAATVLLGNERLDAESCEMAALVNSSAKTMAVMVRDLLDFARTGLGGQMPVSLVAADLGQICLNVVGEARVAHSGCTVNLETKGDLTGKWDAARLRQLVGNLVGNAMQHGGTARRVDLSAAAGVPGVVTLAVHNGGPPIPPDVLPTIFEPLVRDASRELSHRQAGSIGLGLYIARSIATAHGGTIDVTSSAHAGTTFTLHLPTRPAADSGREASKAQTEK